MNPSHYVSLPLAKRMKNLLCELGFHKEEWRTVYEVKLDGEIVTSQFLGFNLKFCRRCNKELL